MESDTQTAVDIAETIIALAPSGLFDATWYCATYGERGARGDPLVDFCNAGWRELRRPNVHFDTGWYLVQNPDVVECGTNPLLHYLRQGERENRRPAAHFDVAWYRSRYGLDTDSCCLAHHLANRRVDPTSPNEWFDAAWYLIVFADRIGDGDPFEHYHQVGSREAVCALVVAQQIVDSGVFDARYYRESYGIEGDNLNLAGHFCQQGWQAGFNPSRFFNTGFYLEHNSDVRESGSNPLLHYILDGAAENRAVSEWFDATQYLSAYGAVNGMLPLASCIKATNEKAELLSWLRACPSGSGTDDILLARTAAVISASGLFDENFYLIHYPDVRLNGIEPLEHFCRYGEPEGRRPNPYFDPGWYHATYRMQEYGTKNSLLHYILVGEDAHNRPIVYFDPSWYAKKYQIAPAISPLLHYLRNRRRQVLSPIALFDVEGYAERFADTAGPNRDLFAHYLRVGISDDIDPGPSFDAASYRRREMAADWTPSQPSPGAEIHEKVRREKLNPLVHFLYRSTTRPEWKGS